MERNKGDCYEVHANHIIRIWLKNNTATELRSMKLCHGEVIGAKGSPVAGERFGHCWIEIHKDVIMDLSNGTKIIGRIDEVSNRIIKDTVKRYKANEIAKLLVKHGHYGPWEE